MKVINTINEIKEVIKSWREDNLSVGLVPTMGYLHDGHMSLVNKSISENDRTVLSIFVNPIQFGEGEDLESYPRDTDRDIGICEAHKVDVIFMPDVSEMYPDGFNSQVNVKDVSYGMTGESRPGHFEGVCTVVTKLFNIVEPSKAYFGQKDAQQLAVINKMVKDLNMNLEIVGCPTMREEDGLAMSSRNSYLDEEEREKASSIYKALLIGKKLFDSGENRADQLKQIIDDEIIESIGIGPEYIEIVDSIMMQTKQVVAIGDMCLISVKIGKTTLIDNIIF